MRLTRFITFAAGYVEEIKELLLTMSETKMKQIYEKYSSKAPDPMNTQFPDKLSKTEAVKQYHARKQLVTELFPVGKLMIESTSNKIKTP